MCGISSGLFCFLFLHSLLHHSVFMLFPSRDCRKQDKGTFFRGLFPGALLRLPVPCRRCADRWLPCVLPSSLSLSVLRPSPPLPSVAHKAPRVLPPGPLFFPVSHLPPNPRQAPSRHCPPFTSTVPESPERSIRSAPPAGVSPLNPIPVLYRAPNPPMSWYFFCSFSIPIKR